MDFPTVEIGSPVVLTSERSGEVQLAIGIREVVVLSAVVSRQCKLED
jgi:hypothetical protein